MDSVKPITFGSLFAGIGGFDLGFERAGMQCRWQVEIDVYATKVLEKHWPHVHRERDIRTVGRRNLEQVDVICGGFPCQDISYAGLGAGLDGERSGLFFEAVRVVRELQPRVVVLENVAALLTRGLDRVLGTLASIGFDAEWHCIPAAAFGAPHIRDRVFVLAYSDCIGSPMEQHRGKLARTRTKEKEPAGEPSVCLAARRNVPNPNIAGLERQWAFSIGTIKEFRNACHDSWWHFEPSVGRVANGIPRRVDRLRGLGNAVVPQVAEYIGKHVMEVLQ